MTGAASCSKGRLGGPCTEQCTENVRHCRTGAARSLAAPARAVLVLMHTSLGRWVPRRCSLAAPAGWRFTGAEHYCAPAAAAREYPADARRAWCVVEPEPRTLLNFTAAVTRKGSALLRHVSVSYLIKEPRVVGNVSSGVCFESVSDMIPSAKHLVRAARLDLACIAARCCSRAAWCCCTGGAHCSGDACDRP